MDGINRIPWIVNIHDDGVIRVCEESLPGEQIHTEVA